ncbi:MAG: RHS repeat-associated core domain-containing protein, partial [Clostridia bacterium]|nr:RHS repeat-associated core domain-containing protein [Clostridia bacterium]
TYDVIGNPTNDTTWTYTWENGRQLKQMSKSGTTATFLYNADGLRIRKTVGNTVTNYTLHGSNLVHMVRGSTALHFFYDAQNRPAIVDYAGTKYAYVYSLQGDVLGLVNSSGTEVVRYVYDAWGRVLATTGTLASTVGTIQPFRYRGYIYDTETGMYYLRSRYYNPVWQRFLNADSLLKGNVYQYCSCQPVNLTDFDGFDAIWITDRTSFTHASLLVQDAENRWYYFYWGARRTGLFSSELLNMGANVLFGSLLSPISGNGIVIYEEIRGKNGEPISFSKDMPNDEFLSKLNTTLSDSSIYAGDYDDYIYLTGDYAKSHNEALTMKARQKELRYDLIFFNCAHAVCNVLLRSIPTDSDLYKGILDISIYHFHPGVMHDCLSKLVDQHLN